MEVLNQISFNFPTELHHRPSYMGYIGGVTQDVFPTSQTLRQRGTPKEPRIQGPVLHEIEDRVIPRKKGGEHRRKVPSDRQTPSPEFKPRQALHHVIMRCPCLTTEQLEFWEKNGYLIIPDAISREVVEELVSETGKLLNEFSLEGHPMTKFSTGGEDGFDAAKHVGDDYFLTSNDKIRFFFEEDAFDSTGTLIKPKAKAINKIGHALHSLSPPFTAMTLTRRNRDIAHSLGFRDPHVLQSMIICKQPEIGGAVPSHQDSTFLYTDPPSAVGFWYALEDTTAENGCLSFVPGSHRSAPIKKRFVRLKEGGTGFEDVESGKGNGDREKGGVESEEEWAFVMGPVKRGSLVLIHGNVLHKSERNLSEISRWIYTFHVIEGEHEYDEKNWLQPPAGGFSKLNDAV